MTNNIYQVISNNLNTLFEVHWKKIIIKNKRDLIVPT